MKILSVSLFFSSDIWSLILVRNEFWVKKWVGAKCWLQVKMAETVLFLSLFTWASQVVQWWRLHLQCRRHGCVQCLGREYPLEEGMATHSSILPWRIPWTEESGRLYSIGSQRVDMTEVTTHTLFSFTRISPALNLTCHALQYDQHCHKVVSELS